MYWKTKIIVRFAGTSIVAIQRALGHHHLFLYTYLSVRRHCLTLEIHEILSKSGFVSVADPEGGGGAAAP